MVPDLTCDICFEPFLASILSDGQDRRPQVLCSNGHSFCSECCSRLPSSQPCPTCRQPRLPTPIVNIALLKLVEGSNEALSNIPEIPRSEVTLTDTSPIAMGSYSEVFICKWNHQNVAVKRLRITQKSELMKSLKLETSLAISLFHPNIVRIFGTLQMENGLMGIVMEWADQGSLGDKMKRLTFSQKVRVSLDICDGVAYLHAQKIAHRDLKPDNVLLFGAEPKAKISDFGTSKVIQTMITNTSMAGTPKYSAPELMEEGLQFGRSVDVFSLAIIFYELFSGLDPFPGCKTVVQVIAALLQDKRPDFPSNFPDSIKDVIRKGWSKDPIDRPGVKAFQTELKKLDESDKESLEQSVMTIQSTSFTLVAQTSEISLMTMPVPLISMQWRSECELENSRDLRATMISNIQQSSNFKTKITASILKAMEVVPRHLFYEPSRVPGKATTEKLQSVYTYNKAMGATQWSNESSPEIVGIQLSLVKINTGSRVLLIGGKGGYINSVVAQVVGISGNLVTISSNSNILNVCKERVTKSSPLARIMEWRVIDDVTNPDSILESFEQKFHAIIYCGAVKELPLPMGRLIAEGGSLIAPVQVGDNQQFQMIIQETANKREIRKITDFGVIFEKAQ